jgi:SAM-dependent methyltransferase
LQRQDIDLSNLLNFFIQTDLAQLQEHLQFDPNDPFPLLELGSYTYEAAKNHSVQVDQWLGFPLKEEPLQIAETQTWSHLSPQQFQTPYCEIRNILNDLNPVPTETFIDLGCGYGRFAFVLDRHYKRVNFKGFEVDPNRVRVAQERIRFHQLHHAQVDLKDITDSDFHIPEASYYFLFDFGQNDSILKILEALKVIAQRQNIQVVGRGRATRHFIQERHPWLSQVNEPRHTLHYSIYKS